MLLRSKPLAVAFLFLLVSVAGSEAIGLQLLKPGLGAVGVDNQVLLTGHGGPPDSLFLSESFLVDSPVDDKHDEDGCPKGQGGGDESVRLVDAKDAFVGMSFAPFL